MVIPVQADPGSLQLLFGERTILFLTPSEQSAEALQGLLMLLRIVVEVVRVAEAGLVDLLHSRGQVRIQLSVGTGHDYGVELRRLVERGLACLLGFHTGQRTPSSDRVQDPCLSRPSV